MRDFHAIIKRLKLYLAKGKRRKVLDKEVADALRVSQSYFATIKRRNAIPYEQLLLFCEEQGLCANELFFEKEGM
ncbi:MAG: hypothetical protein IE916_08915 [Epsilonproteobacteria bacterium]|nr:hypothetical protein [Campylobacterota bacterium]